MSVWKILPIAAVVSVGVSAPLAAEDSKEQSCAYQGDVVAAVQEARVNRVRERRVQRRVMEAGPTWPENYNAVIPLVTPWVYELPRAEMEKDLRAAWIEACMSQ